MITSTSYSLRPVPADRPLREVHPLSQQPGSPGSPSVEVPIREGEGAVCVGVCLNNKEGTQLLLDLGKPEACCHLQDSKSSPRPALAYPENELKLPPKVKTWFVPGSDLERSSSGSSWHSFGPSFRNCKKRIEVCDY